MTTYALPKMDAQCSKPKGLREVQDPCAAESVSTSQKVVLYSTWVLAENYAFTHSVSEKDSLDLQYLHVYRNAQGVVGCTGKLMYQLSVACTFRKAHTEFEYLPLLDIVQGTTMASNSVNSSTGVYKPPSSAVETYYYQSCAAGIPVEVGGEDAYFQKANYTPPHRDYMCLRVAEGQLVGRGGRCIDHKNTGLRTETKKGTRKRERSGEAKYSGS